MRGHGPWWRNLLNGHRVPVKLTSKYLCLCSHISAAVNFDWRSLVLQWVQMIKKLRISNHQIFNGTSISLLPRLREHYGRGGRDNVRRGETGRGMQSPLSQAWHILNSQQLRLPYKTCTRSVPSRFHHRVKFAHKAFILFPKDS